MKHAPLKWIEDNFLFPVQSDQFSRKSVKGHLLDHQKAYIRAALKSCGKKVNSSIFQYGARKTSKSLNTAMVLWYLFHNKDGFSAACIARNLEQSKIIYGHLKSQKKPSYVKYLKDKIINTQNGAVLDFRSNVAGSQLGLENHAVACDEISEHRDKGSLRILETGGAFAQKFLKLYSSNPPQVDDPDLAQLLRDCDRDPDFKVFRYCVPANADWTNRRLWEGAQPFLAAWRKSNGQRFQSVKDYYEKFFARALKSKSVEHQFRRYLLGQFLGNFSGWILPEKVKVCSEDIYKDKSIRWTIGLDYSISFDFTGCVLIGWKQHENSCFVKAWNFLPNTNNRSESQIRLFEQWEREGCLILQRSNVLEPVQVADTIVKFVTERKLKIEKICCDRALSAHHIDFFKGFEIEKIRMTPREMSSAIREAERISHDDRMFLIGKDDPCFRWMIGNCIVNQKSKNYCMLTKSAQKQSIDSCMAMTLGLKALIENPKREFLIMSG